MYFSTYTYCTYTLPFHQGVPCIGPCWLCNMFMSLSPASSPALSQRHLSEAYWSASGFSPTAASHHATGQDEISNDKTQLQDAFALISRPNLLIQPTHSEVNLLHVKLRSWSNSITTNYNNKQSSTSQLHNFLPLKCLHYIFIALQLLRSICQGQAILQRAVRGVHVPFNPF